MCRENGMFRSEKKRSLILMAASACAAAVFIMPMLYDIINLGNETGLAVCAVLFLYGMFFGKVNELIRRLWRQRAGKIVLSVLGAVIGVFAVLAVVLGFLMISGAYKTPQEKSTVIVLGCDVIGEDPGPMLKERLDKAYEWLMEHPGNECIVSGGLEEIGDAVEAKAMKNYLVKRGIAEDHIWIEDYSHSTYENLLYSGKIISDFDLNPVMTIVTSDFHEYRALDMADSLGFKAGSVPSHTAWWLMPTYYVRECAGILHWWWFGW